MTPKQKLAEILDDLERAMITEAQAQQALSNWFIETLDEVLGAEKKIIDEVGKLAFRAEDDEKYPASNNDFLTASTTARASGYNEAIKEAKANALKILGVSNE